MKSCTNRKFLCLLSLVIVLTASSLAECASSLRLAVMNTTKEAALLQHSEIAVNTFTGTLAKSSALDLAERAELDVILHEQKIGASELENSAAKIGGIMGCQYVLLVSMIYGDSPVITARLVDAETSAVIYSDTEIPDTLDDSALTSTSSRMADKLLEVLTGEQAVITELRDYGVTINRGSSSGVRAGDLYRVYKGTKRINVNFAVIRVKDVHALFSYAEVVKNGGYIEAVRRSDKVEAISEAEAEKLIKRGKFTQYRPQERGYEDASLKTIRKAADPLEEYINYFQEVVVPSADKLEKRCMNIQARIDANESVKVGEVYDAAYDCRKFGNFLLRDKTSGELSKFMRKFETTHIDKSNENSRRVYAGYEKYNQQLDGAIQALFSTAVYFFALAADAGDVYSMNELGNMYYSGEGAAQDYLKAMEYYTLASDKGCSLAAANLGNMYYKGEGVPQDYVKAAQLYEQAKDITGAQIALGHMYSNGWGVKQDYVKAAEYYSLAAEKGNPQAQFNLGVMYHFGQGVEQNYKKAVELYSQAADKGYVDAQNNLGHMYENGYGVPKNVKKAIEFYRKAAAQGNETARQNLKRLGAN